MGLITSTDYMKSKIKKIFDGESGSIFKGMIVLFIGTGLSRVFGILCIPILTRIYTPEDYGVLALYVSFIAILAPVLTLRYVQAIPLPKTDTLAMNLLVLCLLLILADTALLTLILGSFKEIIFPFFSMEKLSPWWGLVILGAFGTALYELLTFWATRKKQYKLISKAQVSQSFISNSIKICLGLLSMSTLGLISGQFLAQTSGISGLMKSCFADYKLVCSKINIKRIIFLAKYYKDFVLFRLPSQILLAVSVQAPVLMMASLYNQDITGQLSLAFMALSLPATLIGQSVSRAYYGEVASIGKSNIKKIKVITTDVQKKLFYVGVPITIIMVFFSQPVFKIVFGPEWGKAGLYAEMMSPYILMQLTSGPLVQVLNILGSQVAYLIINCSRIFGLVVIYYISHEFKFDENEFVLYVSLYLFAFYLIITFAINKMINDSVRLN